VDIDLHQLELRHEDLRIRDAERRGRLIASVAEIGQQVPVIVIGEHDRFVLIDGYLRVEALRRLQRDTARAAVWPLSEIDALLHHRHLAESGRVAIEDAWLLARLRSLQLPFDELARRLCRSTSWVSRRLALLEVLPADAHALVRGGTVPPHAAMKYLVPLARANRRHCDQLIAGLGTTRVSVRELGALYDAWRRADKTVRPRIVAEPLLFLRALQAQAAHTDEPEDAAASLLKDLTAIAAISGRARRRVHDGATWSADHRTAWQAARHAVASLGAAIEELHAGPASSRQHPDAA